MKIAVPQFANKAELFSYLRKNADKIIAQKKALPTTTDNLEFGYSKVEGFKPNKATKAAAEAAATTEDVEKELQVEIIANVSGWCDSQMDVMIKDNWNKSINDIGASGQKIIYHLKNHDYCTDSIIGKDASLYTKDIDLSIFNIKSDIKKAQALLMSSTVCQDYCEKTFMLYEDGQIKQHSIGLQYVKIYMCINSEDPEDAQYKDNWDKYYPQVINKDKIDIKGYFWAVVESKILEVSAVLFGANELTPVISTSQPDEDTETDPLKNNQSQPSQNQQQQVQQVKSVAICPTCNSFINCLDNSPTSCPSCGQFVSHQSSNTEMSTIDLITSQDGKTNNWEAMAATIV